MLLQLHDQMKLLMNGSCIRLKIHPEAFSSFGIRLYKNLPVIDVQSLDHLPVDKKKELGIPSIIPVIQTGMDPKPEFFSVKALRKRHLCPEPVMTVQAIPVISSHIKIFPLTRGSIRLLRSDKTSFFDLHVLQRHLLHDRPAF